MGRGPKGKGTRARLDDLAWADCTLEEMSAASGLAVDRIDRLYDDPVSASAAEVQALLRAHRLLCPDVDEMLVERFIAGDPPPDCRPNIPERREIVRQLFLNRWSHREIAQRVCTNHRTVDRILNELGLTEDRRVTG
jgi:DNA-binding NarL/FixJ family response regulator